MSIVTVSNKKTIKFTDEELDEIAFSLLLRRRYLRESVAKYGDIEQDRKWLRAVDAAIEKVSDLKIGAA